MYPMNMNYLVGNALKSSFLMALIHTVVGKYSYSTKNITREPTYEHRLRTSDLMCYVCFNEVDSDNCITMADTSKIWVLRCKEKDTFCKVRRFETKGELTTLDRDCAKECTPGCSQGIINEECISCCSTPLCNTDNGATDKSRFTVTLPIAWLTVFARIMGMIF